VHRVKWALAAVAAVGAALVMSIVLYEDDDDLAALEDPATMMTSGEPE
jgi:hypothetical protein